MTVKKAPPLVSLLHIQLWNWILSGWYMLPTTIPDNLQNLINFIKFRNGDQRIIRL